MKIMQVNKFHHGRGGANRYYLELSRMLEGDGHQVIHFSMKDEDNLPSPYAEYFVENVDFHRADGLLERARCFGRVVYSFEAKRKIRKIIDRHRPEIVHLHNIYHHLSPSIIPVIAEKGLPVIMTAHDYKLICPNYTLFDGTGICGKCLGGKSYQVVLTGCHRSSFAMGLTLAIEAYLHKFLGSYRDHLDRIVVPSNFMGRTFVEHGISPEKIEFIPNFVDPIPDRIGGEEGDYLLYFGRISGEKGLKTLIRAMRNFPENRLIVAGDGPEKDSLLGLCSEESIPNVHFVGHKGADEVRRLIERCMFTVIPSIWYENCPLSVLESMAGGKPVIGSRIGGIPELIEEDSDGLLFIPGNEDDLSEKIRSLVKDGEYRNYLGTNGHRKVRRDYNKETHSRRITALYKELLDR